jgi:glucose-1-phosphate cytidylyltransferase
VKVAILAGGVGSRLGSETESRPKPLVDVGGRPLLWHIMQGFARHGLREFTVASATRVRRSSSTSPTSPGCTVT